MIYFTVIERVRSFMDAREEEAKRMKSLKRGSPKTRGGGGARRTETPPKLV
jgi:hypothetical protein